MDTLKEDHSKVEGLPLRLDCPPPASDGSPIDVDVRFTTRRLSSINTTHSTADVRIGVVLYWTDPRLVGCTLGEFGQVPGHFGQVPELVSSTS